MSMKLKANENLNQVAPDSRTWYQKWVGSWYTFPRVLQMPDSTDFKLGEGGVLRLNTYISLDLIDRIRVLFSGKLIGETLVTTEKEAGHIHVQSQAYAVPSYYFEERTQPPIQFEEGLYAKKSV